MKNKLTIFLLSLVVLTSCDDTLDNRLSTSIEADAVVTDVESLNIVTRGTYSLLADPDLINRSLLLIPELLSDNAYINSFDNAGRYLDYDNYTVASNDTYASSTWDDLYRIVAQTSVIIREANDVEFLPSETDEANHYIGEAYTLRALAFLYLQQFFAQPYNYTSDASHPGVPLPDFSVIGGVEIIEPGRSTTAEVYSQIVSDLSMAVDLLGDQGSPYRVTLNAAKGLLARTHLHMENWEGARDMATEVIESGNYDLVDREQYVESWAQDATSETIFTVVNNLTDNSGSNSIGYFYLGYEDAFATEDLISTFDEGDVRRELYPYSEEYEEYMIIKYPRFENQDDNIQLVRLSEMYLIKAEAHARLNETAEAQEAIDAIRQRANPDAETTSTTGDALIEDILEERRRELAFEGFRLHDLTRTGTTFTKYRQDDEDLVIDAPADQTILPIPLNEINRNPNINQEDQNPGY